MGGRKTRDFLKNKHDQYVRNADFFINEHHRRVFKRAFPAIYDWVFLDRGNNANAVSAEFRGTRNLLALYQTLEALGFSEKPGAGVLLPIRGQRKQPSGILRSQLTSSLSAMGLY